MKHLLIIFSFLLLSSPVIGDNHKGETLYKWDPGEDLDYKWMGFGDKDTQPVYKGQVKDGKPNGLGVMIYPNSLLGGKKYVGEWKDGRKHGQGTQTYLSGGRVTGIWKDGDMWNGTFYDKNGRIIYKYVNGHGPFPTFD